MKKSLNIISLGKIAPGYNVHIKHVRTGRYYYQILDAEGRKVLSTECAARNPDEAGHHAATELRVYFERVAARQAGG